MPRAISKEGLIYSQKVKALADLKHDDDAAAAEAEAQNGVPGYCGMPCHLLFHLELIVEGWRLIVQALQTSMHGLRASD